MRQVLIAGFIAGVVLGCSSTGSLPEMMTTAVSYNRVWHAAVAAMRDLGAEIVVQIESIGVLEGKLDAVELGDRVMVRVQLRSTENIGAEPAVWGTDVSVSASLVSGISTDPFVKEDLKAIEKAYIELLSNRLGLSGR